MGKISTAAAVINVLFSTGALAQTLTVGQYSGVAQNTALIDSGGICASQGLPVLVGQVTTSMSTVGGFGGGNKSTIANPGSASNGYGVQWINCTFPNFPAATSFTKQSDGSYTYSPTTPQTATCTAENRDTYTLTSSNGSNGNVTQTDTITIIPPIQGAKISSFKMTTGNTALALAGTTVCYVSTDALYSRSGK